MRVVEIIRPNVCSFSAEHKSTGNILEAVDLRYCFVQCKTNKANLTYWTDPRWLSYFCFPNQTQAQQNWTAEDENKTRPCFSTFSCPVLVSAIASDSLSWLKGMEPDVAFCFSSLSALCFNVLCVLSALICSFPARSSQSDRAYRLGVFAAHCAPFCVNSREWCAWKS